MKILHNATFHTFDLLAPAAEFLAIDHGKIIASGPIQEADTLPGDRIDLNGAAVLPGLTDSHIHLQLYSEALQSVQCETDTISECLRRVKEKVRVAKPGEWIVGTGWNQNVWTEGFGTAAMLDEVSPANPVYLTSKSIHSAWVNSKALEIANIGNSTADPLNGVIDRDENGKATGILFEEAMGLVEDRIPPPTVDQLTRILHSSIPTLHQMGLTGGHNFDRTLCFQALEKMDVEGQLNFRVLQSIPHGSLEHAVETGLRTGFGSEFLKIGSVKLFMDGALGPQTAAMIEPFEGKTTERGILFLDSEQIFEIGQLAARSGISIAAHAIGDNANHTIIEGLRILRQYETANHLPHLRHRIEHVQLLHPSDVDQLQALGLTASMQPIHATSDMDIADQHWGKRAALAYAWKTLEAHGTKLIFGSDAPVESANPFYGIHAAVTRRRQNGYPSTDGWYPAERLTLKSALAGFTYLPADISGWGGKLGRLSVGSYADLIVLDRDPFAVPSDELYTLLPSRTMVNGEWVYHA